MSQITNQKQASLLRVSEQGRVMTIAIHNPPANFLTAAIMAELNQQLVALESRQDIGAVIITSAVEGVFLTHFDVDDIELAFTTIKENHFTILEKEPVFLNFWNKGCKYFNVLGPDGERLEFNEIIK